MRCCPDKNKVIARDYLKKAGFYSYDAAADDEDPVKRWIGREVKRFLQEAHIHLPFLLQLAAAPPEVCEAAAENQDGAFFFPFFCGCLSSQCLVSRREWAV